MNLIQMPETFESANLSTRTCISPLDVSSLSSDDVSSNATSSAASAPVFLELATAALVEVGSAECGLSLRVEVACGCDAVPRLLLFRCNCNKQCLPSIKCQYFSESFIVLITSHEKHQLSQTVYNINVLQNEAS